jgi:DNA-binding beta-propeller fold protein YncE
VTVSPDGRQLYINTGITVHVVDAGTLSPIAELPYRSLWPVAVSPDDRLVAIAGLDLTILRTSDYSVVFSDTNYSLNGVFSSDSKTFFCAGRASSQDPYVVTSVDLSRRPYRLSRKAFSDGNVLRVVPSRNKSKWFVYLAVHTWLSAFEVYDARTDSVIFRDFLTPGAGQLALTPDDRFVFYTNPGNGATGPMPPDGFSVYDVRANSARDIIDPGFFGGVYGDSVAWWSPPTYLAVTPDGRWLVMMSGMMTAQSVYLWDIPAGRPVHRWMGFQRQYYNLSVETGRLSRH